MSYFGTSGPPSRVAHSIAAGYQRRSNQIAARKTSPYLGNIGGVADNALGKLKQSYGRSLSGALDVIRVPPYGDSQKLVDEAERFTTFHNEHKVILKGKLDKSTKRRKLANFHKVEVTALHAEITAELAKDPADRQAMVVLNKTDEARSIYPTYTYVNWPGIQAELQLNENNAISQEAADKANFDDAVKTLNTDMVKGMEDWFVDGGLVKESHARGYTTGGLIVGAVGAIILWRWLHPSKLTTRSDGNKSAAMAVFR